MNKEKLYNLIMERQNGYSQRISKNIFRQILVAVVGIGLVLNTGIVIKSIENVTKINPEILLMLIPFYLYYLFIEFGFTLNSYIIARRLSKNLFDELLLETKKEEKKYLDYNMIRNVMRDLNIFEPMAIPFEKDNQEKSTNLLPQLINLMPQLIFLIFISLNHLVIFFSIGKILKDSHISISLVKTSLVYGINYPCIFIVNCIFCMLTIPFYLIYIFYNNRGKLNETKIPQITLAIYIIMFLCYSF
ncbi:MAG: hypothetical protein A2X12_09740 [Bacteroidetes bacterium GWE2_29_8]|nr:MAG: hypothetical protein A2X12_09740 [Bacteroidetes bacterium GWE2_29_8]OFY16618.1 MAG: hypothetical protein A2X02_05625 [Bacteroidetes bacterium GWF2_29_10]